MKKILLFCFIALSAGTARSQWINQNALLVFQGYMFDIQATDINTCWGTPFNYTSGTAAYTKNFMRTVDGGGTWTKGSITGSPAANVISNIWPIDGNTCYVAMNKNTAAGGGVYKTTNGGVNWSIVGSNMFTLAGSFPDFVYFFDAQNGIAMGDPDYATTGKYEIYTTSDAGVTWTRVPAGNLPSVANTAEFGITNLFTASQGHVWFGTTYGDLYHSADKGMTWTKAVTSLPASLGTTRQDIDDIAFTDSLHGIVTQLDTSGKMHVVQTSDGGMTFDPITPVGRLLASDIDAVPGTNALICAGSQPAIGFGTSFSVDNGATWITMDTVNSQTAISFVNNQTGWTSEYLNANATTGGAWSYDGAPLAVISKFAATKETQIFPNPSNGTVHVIATASSRKTNFNVYDLQGKNVYSETAETLAMYNHELNLSGLAIGVYVLKITDGQTTSEHKLIIE